MWTSFSKIHSLSPSVLHQVLGTYWSQNDIYIIWPENCWAPLEHVRPSYLLSNNRAQKLERPVEWGADDDLSMPLILRQNSGMRLNSFASSEDYAITVRIHSPPITPLAESCVRRCGCRMQNSPSSRKAITSERLRQDSVNFNFICRAAFHQRDAWLEFPRRATKQPHFLRTTSSPSVR